MTQEDITQTLRKELPHLREQYQVESLAIFGSYTKNTHTKNSDLDLLVTFSDPPSFFKFIRLENHLSELLGINVDLVMKDALKKNIGERIQKELVQVQ